MRVDKVPHHDIALGTYLHHLDRCGEMLGPMLATIHNLHFYLDLMREVREALDAGRFGAFAARFKSDRKRGV
jgi:queuine tRNA-ribosyltransferase